VVRDHPAQHLVRMLGIPQVAGAVELMQAGMGQFGQISDVM
jgi:hypothetical protein